MKVGGPSVFEGLPEDVVESLLDQLERRSFPTGALVIAEGDSVGEMYIVQAGSVEVFMVDRDGVEHVVNGVGPGGTLGEISLITGHPHSASVRATAPLEVLVVTDAEFKQIAANFPALYRNLVAILSQRLVRSNRRAVGSVLGRSTLLVDHGAPPLLGYALACSVAWHTRHSVLLLRIDTRPASPDLKHLADGPAGPMQPTALPAFGPAGPLVAPVGDARAHLLLAEAGGAFAPDALATTLDHLAAQYAHILVQVPRDLAPAFKFRRRLALQDWHARPALDGYADYDYVVRGWSETASTRPSRTRILDVPAPDGHENSGWAGGLLPSTGSAGRSLGWAARDMAALKVGLALGAGAMRGYAHVGVLRLLQRKNVPIDFIAGTSIGSAIAAMHSLGYAPEEIARTLDGTAPAVFRLTLPTRGLLSNTGLQNRFKDLGGGKHIEDLEVPLAITATDLNSRREVVFVRGLLWPSVLASLTIPGVYPAQVMGPYTLVDGGITNPLPVGAAAGLGADAVIASKLTGGVARAPEEIQSEVPSGRSPSVLDVIMRTLEITQSNIPAGVADVPTVVIAPEFAPSRGLGLRNFHEGRRFVEVGEAAAEASLPRLAATLPWLR